MTYVKLLDDLTMTLSFHLKANEQIKQENFGEQKKLVPKILWSVWRVVLRSETCLCVCCCRHSQRDYCTNRWRAAGTPAHRCAARGRNLTLGRGFLKCCSLSSRTRAHLDPERQKYALLGCNFYFFPPNRQRQPGILELLCTVLESKTSMRHR